jgi:hypothetical protein
VPAGAIFFPPRRYNPAHAALAYEIELLEVSQGTGIAMRHTTKNLKNRRKLQKLARKTKTEAKAVKRKARRATK